MQIQRREGYELQFVKAMVTGSEWQRATTLFKTQQPVMINWLVVIDL